MRLVQINVHPLKSGAIRPVKAARVLRHGLEDDRTWMVVDPDGDLVSARELHELFHVVADTRATDPTVPGALRLRADGHRDLVVERAEGAIVPVRLFSLDLLATRAGEAADAWLRSVLGADLRLVWCHDPDDRRLEPGFADPDDHAAFPDAFPLTIASLASLRQLNDWITERSLQLGEEPSEPLAIERFRANLVVDGDQPFAEDHWRELVVGDVRLRVAKPVARCVMTTVDPETLHTAKEPIRTLARHRLDGGQTLFATHLVPISGGTIAVGDEVSAS